jgi:phage-related protein
MNLVERFQIVYSDEAWDFLLRIGDAARTNFARNIEKARFALDPQLLKKLTGEIWEFRALYQGKQYRLLAFWDKRDGKNTLVFATHGFIKKTDKVPQKEVEKAKMMMERYFNYKNWN